MELVWIEDLIELSAARNFSVAAEARGITQPAFSRRIQTLENWVGVQLIDRSSYPIKLTAAGENVLEVGRSLVLDVHRVRDECRQLTLPGTEAISYGALHSIALNICPEFLKRLDHSIGPFRVRIEALDYYETIDALSAGRCDLAFCYAHPWGPPILKAGHFRTLILEKDPFVLTACPDEMAAMEDHLSKGAGKLNVPLVAYTPDCFLGKMQDVLTKRIARDGITFQTVFECSMSEVVKRMILTGRGVGWLPRSVIEDELADNRLAILGQERSRADLDVVLFRRHAPSKPTVERIWSEALAWQEA